MRRKRGSAAVFVLLAGLALAGPSAAQVRTQEPVDRAASGTITVVDTVARTVTVRDPEAKEATFRVNDDTTILEGGQRIRLDQLKKGDHVALDSDDHEGLDVATYIEVVDVPKP